jgi:hypothetical protein
MDNKLAIENINAQKALIGKFVLDYEIRIFNRLYCYADDIKKKIYNAKKELLKSMFEQTEVLFISYSFLHYAIKK